MSTYGQTDVFVTKWDTLSFSWSRTNYSISGNYSDVYWEMKLVATSDGRIDSRVQKDYSVVINGNTYTGKNYVGISNNSSKILASGTTRIYHNSDGTKSFNYSFSQYFGITWSNTTFIGTKSGSGSGTLDTIPRYANITSFKVDSTALNSITLSWNANAECDWVQYSLNSGAWINTSGTRFTIGNLQPNTNYSIKIKVRRKDSQLWTTSNSISGRTKDIARISQSSNFEFGDSVQLVISNPSGNTKNIKLKTLNPEQTILSRNNVDNSIILTLTDDEWDTLYSKLGNNNSMNIRYVVETIGNNVYTDFKDNILTLTGNMKTARIGTLGETKRAKVFFNDNGTIRRAVGWMKINGEIKRVY